MITISKAILSDSTIYGRGYNIVVNVNRSKANWKTAFVDKVTISKVSNKKSGKVDTLFDYNKAKIKSVDESKVIYETSFGLYVVGMDFDNMKDPKPGTIEITVSEEYPITTDPEGLNEVEAEADLNGSYIDCTSNLTASAFIYDKYKMFQVLAQYIKAVDTCCDIPKDYIHLFLQYTSFKLAIETCNDEWAQIMYDRIMGNSLNSKPKSCGCNGRIFK